MNETVKNMRLATGMNIKQYAEYFGIPYRTYQDWENGNRKMPEYVLRLMEYKLRAEGVFHDENK